MMRLVLVILAIMLGVSIAGGIAYGGGIKNVYYDEPSLGAYAGTALFLFCLYGVWLTRNR